MITKPPYSKLPEDARFGPDPVIANEARRGGLELGDGERYRYRYVWKSKRVRSVRERHGISFQARSSRFMKGIGIVD